ncbi:hypothetical protein PHMEG_00025653 [Phytophthora megakarya]|uniref:Uncharacterized protein n=1 Tax=Phytophthora megakarya TaxID=4795 RepID=A0A225VAL5_9STRA|nr:hypothetical protein PHMEG_00025653 [Phytophthora megakarya]
MIKARAKPKMILKYLRETAARNHTISAVSLSLKSFEENFCEGTESNSEIDVV